MELQPSKLGTKDHWDKVYEEELSNFEEFGDEGEIWFGTESVEKMRDWAGEHVPISSQPYILEIGSGNGTLLFSLTDAGYDPSRLFGIDYSPDAVRLATSIAETRGTTVEFTANDFLKEDTPMPPSPNENEGWNLILDKGTFDAMALATKDDSGQSPHDVYPHKIANALCSEGYFLITSCNFTEDELKEIFAKPRTGLTYHSRIQHPTYTFGGKSGSICASVAFYKPK
ncbi:S-adenosyl-L-methionine-dependent methyltransferase [Rickenella mellea]|uniref:Protein-lysine N-methyltransferase EFM4 n=1 Tax=Rickenella mellea TaxID=50990 RepID=A0A4Y7QDL5_9AGAM|nr:S-adenosyl-L-methionine-dependent methyltransferase [Rickenella mellea]